MIVKVIVGFVSATVVAEVIGYAVVIEIIVLDYAFSSW